MANGVINTCKECKKEYQRGRSRSPEGRLKDRQRNATPRRKKWLREYLKKRRKKDKLKTWASNKMWKAILSGKIKKGLKCILCGSIDKIQAHHTDYTKPLDVMWLCDVCHRKQHRQFKRI